MESGRSFGKYVPPAAWAAFIFATSSTYVPSRTFVHSVGKATHTFRADSEAQFARFWDSWWCLFVKGYHVLEYLLLTLLLFRPLLAWRKPPIGLYWAGLAAFLYASSDEFHQTFVKDRGGRWTDVAIDSIGIAVAVGLGLIWARRRLGAARQLGS